MPRIVLCLGEGSIYFFKEVYMFNYYPCKSRILSLFLICYTLLSICLPTRHTSVYTQCLLSLPNTCLCTHNVFLTYPTHVCVHTMSFFPTQHTSVYTQCLSYLPNTCLCTRNVFIPYPTHVCVHTMSFFPTQNTSVYTQCLSYLPNTCLCTHSVCLPTRHIYLYRQFPVCLLASFAIYSRTV